MESMESAENLNKSPQVVTGLAVGGLLASLLASSCCILPFVFVSIGIGGTWMSTLTSLSPYQPYFLVAAAGFLGWGLRQAYRKQDACVDGSLCAKPAASRTTKSLLWAGTGLALAALGVETLLPMLMQG